MKRNAIIICIVVVLALVIGTIMFFLNKDGVKVKDGDRVLVSVYDYSKNPSLIKEIEITDKKEIKKLKRLNMELTEASEELNVDLIDEVIIVFDNDGTTIYIELGQEKYCYVTEAGAGATRLMNNTPELLEYIKGII